MKEETQDVLITENILKGISEEYAEKKVLIINDDIVSNVQKVKEFTAERNPDNTEELIFKTKFVGRDKPLSPIM